MAAEAVAASRVYMNASTAARCVDAGRRAHDAERDRQRRIAQRRVDGRGHRADRGRMQSLPGPSSRVPIARLACARRRRGPQRVHLVVEHPRAPPSRRSANACQRQHHRRARRSRRASRAADAPSSRARSSRSTHAPAAVAASRPSECANAADRETGCRTGAAATSRRPRHRPMTGVMALSPIGRPA